MSNSSNNKTKSRKGRKGGNASHSSAKFKTGSSFAQRKNEPGFLRDPTVTSKVLDCILDSPNGKRALSRLARTCRAMREPALDTLWRELDSIVPLLWQFPGHVLKKAKKPGMGFVKSPTQEDWDQVLMYADRVRQITYNENAGNVSASIFSILEETRPRPYILPLLTELNWKIETSANLEHCSMFLNPELRVLNLEVGGRAPNLNAFLSNMSSRTTLTSFSFSSPTSLPDAFTNLLRRQTALQEVTLVAPGALAAGVGHWISSLPLLKALRLDLTGRSNIAVEGFFDELNNYTGTSTPNSVASTDSGVFSEEDFSVIRSKTKQLPFANLRKLQLTGEVANISAFASHLDCPLTQLELNIEDPPDRGDWHDLCRLISHKFGKSLRSLKVSAAGSTRVADSLPASKRGERLSLQRFTHLPRLYRLEIDLPETITFTEADVEGIAKACPNLRILKLCPTAKANNPPQLTLDTLAKLLIRCKRLHTIAAVIDAKQGNPDILRLRDTSSKSLLRLHVGHSWIEDPLHVAILISHLAPRLETLKFFQENNRPGFNENHARNWQKMMELLPHLQGIRLLEQQLASSGVVYLEPEVEVPEMCDKAVEAIVRTVERGVYAVPEYSDAAIQHSPVGVDQMVQAEPTFHSIEIDATPQTVETAVEAIVEHVEVAIEAIVEYAEVEIDATPPPVVEEPKETPEAEKPNVTKAVETLLTPYTFRQPAPRRRLPPIFLFPSILGLISLAYRLLVLYPMSVPSRIIRTATAQVRWRTSEPKNPIQLTSHHDADPTGPEVMELDTISDIGDL